jgi:hypothetical protein
MDLGELTGMGLVAPNELVRREVSVRYFPVKPKEQWADQDVEEREEKAVEGKVTVFLRKLRAADTIAVLQTSDSEERMYLTIQRTVCKEDGSRLFPRVEDAYGIGPSLFHALLKEINSLGRSDGKKKNRAKTSGANSLSPSVDAP